MENQYLVVGGSSGIGLEIVKGLIAQGHSVTVWSRTPGQLPVSPLVQHVVMDVTSETYPVESIPEALAGLVYCPGTIQLKPFRSLSPAQFREDWEINVLGAVKALQAAEKALKKGGAVQPASVILFSTVAVQKGMPFHASIAAAKGALEGLGRSLATELAPAVRVNVIAPSLTDTPLAERLLNSEEKQKSAAERHLLKRVGTAPELAATALFLLSPQASWITGQILGVDGGMGVS